VTSDPALIDILDRWQPGRVVVVGDLMLDRYTYGQATRLSPDAPVPVLTIRESDDRPGGAANVCLALRALNCEVTAVGVVGDDEVGQSLRNGLDHAGCDTRHVVTDPTRPTTLKHNLVGLAQQRHPQKMFRLDCESPTPLSAEVADQLVAAATDALDEADVLCLEDYGKGVLAPDVCRRLIEAARQRNVPVLVDPAPIDDYTRYRGATAITPNRTEAARATGTRFADTQDNEIVQRMAATLLDQLELDAVVLTLDQRGLLLHVRDHDPVLAPTVARSVYDVTGAGDVLLAMLAAARSAGVAWPESVALANAAAGLEVEHFGVVPIKLDEVLLHLLQRSADAHDKLRGLPALLVELRALRASGQKVAFTNGCFDILHAGHVQFLRQARATGDLLVVGLNTDDSIARLKGPDRPVNPLADRVAVLSELQSVDYVVTFDADTPLELIQAIKPDTLVKGADYTREQVVGHEIVEAHGGRVKLVDLVAGRSTTNIIERVSQK
jgi:D-beta-D-heptose 7-phosphate kinase/D-beta-D-heptose 1-phosphate adenosyltransferase